MLPDVAQNKNLKIKKRILMNLCPLKFTFLNFRMIRQSISRSTSTVLLLGTMQQAEH